jgi:gliding motility-associated lipoprotein GldD
MKFFNHQLFRFVCLTILISPGLPSCNSIYTPKPKGYYAIDFPVKKYKLFDQPSYPYTFEYPVYANVVKDTSYFGQPTEKNPWWINIEFPQFSGKIHVSYKEIQQDSLSKLINESFKLTNNHAVRAYSIEDSLIKTPNGITGVFFNVGGDVATANQFFLTDTLTHFLRGAMYFDATPNADSLSIVNNFLLADMKHLINTIKWRKK